MLGRLFKYEMRATARLLLPIYIAVIAIAGITRMSLEFKKDEDSFLYQLIDIVPLLFLVSVIAVLIITIFVIIWRFYRNVSSDEGYLIFTLPVKTDSIILSELFCAFVWQTVLCVVMLISSFTMIINTDIDGVILDIPFISNFLSSISAQSWLAIISLIGNIMLSALVEIISIYCAISIASLFRKYRIILSVSFYILIMFIIQLLSGIIVGFTSGLTNNSALIGTLDDDLILQSTNDFTFAWNNYIIPALLSTETIVNTIFTIILAIIQYLVIRFILKKHLNIN